MVILTHWSEKVIPNRVMVAHSVTHSVIWMGGDINYLVALHLNIYIIKERDQAMRATKRVTNSKMLHYHGCDAGKWSKYSVPPSQSGRQHIFF